MQAVVVGKELKAVRYNADIDLGIRVKEAAMEVASNAFQATVVACLDTRLFLVLHSFPSVVFHQLIYTLC